MLENTGRLIFWPPQRICGYRSLRRLRPSSTA